MINKSLNLKQAIEVAKSLRQKKQRFVLVGGVFDLFHYGHLQFLQAAKKTGDLLIVALEPDINVRRRKGEGRPIHPEQARAEILAELECIDYVLILPEMKSDADYYKLVEKLKPDIIAVTENDPQIANKRKQAKAVGGELKIVTPEIPTPSTSRLLKILAMD